MFLDTIDIILRMGAAVVAGIVIGSNRDLAGKPMGMRTLALVSLGAAVVSLATIRLEVFSDHPDALSRVVQGIIQGVMGGIGFIGAGVIMRDAQSETIKGLTTAATAWVTAALGTACALAARSIVAVALGLARITLVAVGWAERLHLTGNGEGKGRRESAPSLLGQMAVSISQRTVSRCPQSVIFQAMISLVIVLMMGTGQAARQKR